MSDFWTKSQKMAQPPKLGLINVPCRAHLVIRGRGYCFEDMSGAVKKQEFKHVAFCLLDYYM